LHDVLSETVSKYSNMLACRASSFRPKIWSTGRLWEYLYTVCCIQYWVRDMLYHRDTYNDSGSYSWAVLACARCSDGQKLNEKV